MWKCMLKCQALGLLPLISGWNRSSAITAVMVIAEDGIQWVQLDLQGEPGESKCDLEVMLDLTDLGHVKFPTMTFLTRGSSLLFRRKLRQEDQKSDIECDYLYLIRTHVNCVPVKRVHRGCCVSDQIREGICRIQIKH